MLARTATAVFRTFASITAPCSVNTYGKYLICRPRFKVTICDLKDSAVLVSAAVSRNMKSSGKRGAVALHGLVESSGFDAVEFRKIAVEHHPVAAEDENLPFDDFQRDQGMLGLLCHAFIQSYGMSQWSNASGLKSQFVISNFGS